MEEVLEQENFGIPQRDQILSIPHQGCDLDTICQNELQGCQSVGHSHGLGQSVSSGKITPYIRRHFSSSVSFFLASFLDLIALSWVSLMPF